MLFGHASPDAKDLKFKIGNYKLINPINLFYHVIVIVIFSHKKTATFIVLKRCCF